MSDEDKRTVPSVPTDEENITQKLLTEYFTEKNVTSKCELCGTNLWASTTSIKGTKPRIQATSESDLQSDTYNLPVILAVCTNCGNMRIFARFKIEEWIDERAKIEKANEFEPGEPNG